MVVTYIGTKRHDAQHWKPIVQPGMSQLICSTQESQRMQDHLKDPLKAPANAQHELSDTAAENVAPFDFNHEGSGTLITRTFMFFLYGTFCGSVWTLFLLWMFQ